MKENVRLSRNLKYKGNIVNFYEDEIKLPSGKVVHYDFIAHNGAAAVVPVMPDGRILMVKQYRSALDRFTLEIPAGKLDSVDESGETAALRELEEETGYKALKIEPLLVVNTTVAFCNEKIWIYTAFIDSEAGKQNLDDDEDIEIGLYKYEELEDKILSMEITDSKTIAAIMSYKNKYLD